MIKFFLLYHFFWLERILPAVWVLEAKPALESSSKHKNILFIGGLSQPGPEIFESHWNSWCLSSYPCVSLLFHCEIFLSVLFPFFSWSFDQGRLTSKASPITLQGTRTEIFCDMVRFSHAQIIQPLNLGCWVCWMVHFLLNKMNRLCPCFGTFHFWNNTQAFSIFVPFLRRACLRIRNDLSKEAVRLRPH